MKALSLWQPWASLIATGAKRYETRSWSTNYRGPLVICAAKAGLSRNQLLFYLCLWQFQGGLAPLVGKPRQLGNVTTWAGVGIHDLPFGKAVCIVDLVDCIPIDQLTLRQIGTDAPFGEFTLDRYAWRLENVRSIDPPFPVIGHQGLFEVELGMENDDDPHLQQPAGAAPPG